MVPFYSSFNFLFFIRRHQNGVVSLVFFLIFLYGEKNNSGIRAKGIGIPICDFFFFLKVFMKVEVLIGFKMMRF